MLKAIAILYLSSCVFFSGCAQAIRANKLEKPAANRPNIIYILADDLGYGDIGAYGQEKIKTPHLDNLANNGMVFTNHYAGQTVCSPSRCSLITGKHMGHASVTRNGQLLNASDTTLAELLQNAGYKTGIIGKWGLSEGPFQDNSPNQKGFDHHFGFDNQGFAHFYYPEYLWRNKIKVEYPENLNIRDANGGYIAGKGTYSHDEFAEEALQFIENNKKQPFFLYLPFAIPHAELTIQEEAKQPYRGLNWPETPKPEGGGAKKGYGYGSQYTNGYCAQIEPNITYAAMVTKMDYNIGRIVALLDTLGISENTIIMFSSDNGPSDEGGQDLSFFNSTKGLRGHKRDLYEGGIRVPFIAHWKNKIKRGTTSNIPSAFWDILPTVCDIANVEIPGNIDGVSLKPTLLGNNQVQQKHDYLFWQWQHGKNPNYEALRIDNWKLFRITPLGSQTSYFELYNLDEDPSETNNLAKSRADIVNTYVAYFDAAKI